MGNQSIIDMANTIIHDLANCIGVVPDSSVVQLRNRHLAEWEEAYAEYEKRVKEKLDEEANRLASSQETN